MDGRVLKWVGFAASLMCSVCTGYFLAFNVYDVQLKTLFQLNQTQLELIGSFAVGGLAFALCGSLVFTKYGHKACYFIGWLFAASSGLLMWFSTMYVPFFRERIAFLCIFQLMSSAGMAITQNCCLAIALLHFSSRHSAKVIAIYYATVALGKIYYAALYQIFFKTETHLGEFFVAVFIGISVAILICCVTHKPPSDQINDTERLLAKDNNDQSTTKYQSTVPSGNEKENEAEDDTSPLHQNDWTRKDILKSTDVHLILWPGILCRISAICLLNNITPMAKAVDLVDPEVTVYIMAIGITLSRLCFGSIFDAIRSQFNGFLLLLLIYSLFCLAMIIGLIRFDDFTIFVINVLGAIACGPVIPLTLSILVFITGKKNAFFLAGLNELLFSVFQPVLQVIVGLTYDHIRVSIGTKRLFCKECFQWMFILLLVVNIVSTIITLFGLLKLCWKNVNSKRKNEKCTEAKDVN